MSRWVIAGSAKSLRKRRRLAHEGAGSSAPVPRLQGCLAQRQSGSTTSCVTRRFDPSSAHHARYAGERPPNTRSRGLSYRRRKSAWRSQLASIVQRIGRQATNLLMGVRVFLDARAVSSAAERRPHTARSGGSSPPRPTEGEPHGAEAGCEPVSSGFESRRPPSPPGRRAAPEKVIRSACC